MKKNIIYCSYFKKTAPIWILFIICIYCVFACEFESLRSDVFSFNEEKAVVNKINEIIKNLSFSYIAGVIFFSLSDTIPFLRRKKIAYRNVNKSLFQMINAIDDFSMSINSCKWDEKTNTENVFEDFSGGEYTENAPQLRLTSDKIALIGTLTHKIKIGVNYVISQELYIDTNLTNDMDRIKINEDFHYLCTIADSTNQDIYIAADKVLAIFDNIIEITSVRNKLPKP